MHPVTGKIVPTAEGVAALLEFEKEQKRHAKCSPLLPTINAHIFMLRFIDRNAKDDAEYRKRVKAQVEQFSESFQQ